MRQLAEAVLEALPAERRHEMGIGVAPGLADRLRAADHRHRLQAGEALEAQIVRAQELAAPDRAVDAVAEPVHHHAEHRRRVARDAVLGHAARDMGMVMLHLVENGAFAGGMLLGELGREVFGMQVGGEDARLE